MLKLIMKLVTFCCVVLVSGEMFIEASSVNNLVEFEIEGAPIYLDLNDSGNYEQISENAKSSDSFKVYRRKGSEIYKAIDSDIFFLKVTDELFQAAGEIQVDLTNDSSMNLMLNSNVSDEVKKELQEYSQYLKENNLDGTVAVYSPDLLSENSRIISTPYPGYGGYTYKLESLFYNNRYTQSVKTNYKTKSLLEGTLGKYVEFIVDYAIGKTPYGTPISLLKTFVNSLNLPVDSFTGAELITQYEERRRETRFCHINLGAGRGWQVKAKSAWTEIYLWEHLAVQGKPKENKEIFKGSHTSSYFNNLDRKAYEFKDLTAMYDERPHTVLDKVINKNFILAP